MRKMLQPIRVRMRSSTLGALEMHPERCEPEELTAQPTWASSDGPDPSDPQPRLPSGPKLVIGVLTAVTAALALSTISDRSIWVDEAFTHAVATSPWDRFFDDLAHNGGNMSFYVVAMKVCSPSAARTGGCACRLHWSLPLAFRSSTRWRADSSASMLLSRVQHWWR